MSFHWEKISRTISKWFVVKDVSGVVLLLEKSFTSFSTAKNILNYFQVVCRQRRVWSSFTAAKQVLYAFPLEKNMPDYFQVVCRQRREWSSFTTGKKSSYLVLYSGAKYVVVCPKRRGCKSKRD